jgi:hypothetical protein
MFTENSDRQACTKSSSYVYKEMILSSVLVTVTIDMPGTAERILQLALCCVVVAARPGNRQDCLLVHVINIPVL